MTYQPPNIGDEYRPEPTFDTGPEHGYSYSTHYPKKKRWPIILVVVGIVLLLGCLVGLLTVALKADPTTKTRTPGPASTAAKTRDVTPPAKPVKAKTIGEGTWKVGTEVTPGTYRTPGAKEGIITLCSWQVSTDDDGQHILSIDAVDSTSEPGRVTLKAGRYFKTSGCQDWIKQ